jgi:hypothetical protein
MVPSTLSAFGEKLGGFNALSCYVLLVFSPTTTRLIISVNLKNRKGRKIWGVGICFVGFLFVMMRFYQQIPAL